MLRGGRFDTQIYVGVPDQKAREFLVNKALDGIERDDDMDLSQIALRLEGYGGGDITSICERIKLEPYKREIALGVPQKITCDDCNKILANSHNIITKEEIERFLAYRDGMYDYE